MGGAAQDSAGVRDVPCKKLNSSLPAEHCGAHPALLNAATCTAFSHRRITKDPRCLPLVFPFNSDFINTQVRGRKPVTGNGLVMMDMPKYPHLLTSVLLGLFSLVNKFPLATQDVCLTVRTVCINVQSIT